LSNLDLVIFILKLADEANLTEPEAIDSYKEAIRINLKASSEPLTDERETKAIKSIVFKDD
jgi:hypothetical protein